MTPLPVLAHEQLHRLFKYSCCMPKVGLYVFQFLVYDTQMLVGGRKHELSPEEYIFGALQLYLDIVYLFLIILSLFGKSD